MKDYNLEFADLLQNKFSRESLLEKLATRLFFLILLLMPFGEFWIDREEGTGAFLTGFIAVFGLLSIPNWRIYYRNWTLPILLQTLFICLATISDCVSLGAFKVEFLSRARQFFVNVYFALIVYNLIRRNADNIPKFVFCIVLGGIIPAIFVDLNLGVKEGIEHGVEGTRYAVLGQNSNGTARSIANSLMLLPIVISGMIDIKKMWKILLFILAPFCVLGMLKLSSRGGMMALILVSPFYIHIAKTINKKMLCLFIVSLGLACLVMAILSSEMFQNRLLNTIFNRDTGGREAFFYGCLSIWEDAKWIGHGSMMYTYKLAEFVYGFYGHKAYIASHCAYTYPLAAGGIIGSFLYYGSLISILRRALAIRSLPYGNYAFMAVLYLLIGGISANFEYSKCNFIIFGVVCGIYYWQRACQQNIIKSCKLN